MVLKTALVRRGHTHALFDRTVTPRTVEFEFEFEEVPSIVKAFRRMVRGLEFDVAEMALTTYLCAREYGKAFTAIPVFPVRAFHHGAIVVDSRTGVTAPKDLEGRKVGVNRGYTVTTGLWTRAVLQHEYGVDLGRITWVLSGDEHVAEYRPPENVVPIAAGRTLQELLLEGEIAAAIGVDIQPPNQAIRPLIPDAREAGFLMLRKHSIYPINHTVVIKNERLEQNPAVAAEVFDAFVRAKQIYVDRLRHGRVENPDETHVRVMEMTGDPLPYGIEPNRRSLEAIVQYALEQRILTRPVEIEELFVRL